MSEPPVRLDPADAVPPGERAALADTARHLVDERADLAHTAQDLVGERAGLAETARSLVDERAALAETAQELVKSNRALTTNVATLIDTVAQLARKISVRTWAFVIVIVLDIILTFALGFFGISYFRAQDQIAAIVAQLDRSVHAQCGTLELLIKSYRGQPPPGSPIDPREYNDAYIKIQRQADDVPCGIKHVVPGT